MSVLVTQSGPTVCNPMGCSPPGLCPWNSPGKSTRVGCHALLQGIFLTQGSNPSHPHCRQILYCLSHQESSPRILEWVAYLFSGVSSQPRNRTGVSCIAGGFLPSELPGQPKNTGVGSLSLLRGIFPTQESNWGLLHCRPILYQLNYQGSP